MERKDKTVRECTLEQYYMIFPNTLNGAGRLFGGQLLAWIDELAGVVGKRFSQSNITTVYIDNLHFHKGAYLGDTVVLVAKPTFVGSTSMEVKVTTYVEHTDLTRELINDAYMIMVALDENDRPMRMPNLILETDEDRREWEAAKKRREVREANMWPKKK